jgi:hypothetical protein
MKRGKSKIKQAKTRDGRKAEAYDVRPSSPPRKVKRWLALSDVIPPRIKNPEKYLHKAARERRA